MKKPINNDIITRWLLLFQEFDITIDKPHKENVVAYFLSKITNEGEVIPLEDTFPDEHLMAQYINTLWFSYIYNYLSTRKIPSHLSSKERHMIIKQSAMYSWVQGYMFCIGMNLII
jgi:hypothetical protein